jgi:DNA polymerase I
MRVVGIDWETTKLPYIHPWQHQAFPVLFGIVGTDRQYLQYIFNHNEDEKPIPHPTLVKWIQEQIDKADVLVAHNMKFDHNWLTKVGVNTWGRKLYCTQVAEYIIRGQAKQPYTLDYLSKFYGIPPKHDKVKTFWDAGYETNEIPMEILGPYHNQDCVNTLVIYQKQQELIKQKGLQSLITLEMEKLRVLSEIECNGMRTDRERAIKYAEDFRSQVADLDWQIHQIAGREFNIDSVDELSATLYGGVIKTEGIEEYEVELKSGERKVKSRKAVFESQVDGMGFSPPEGSEGKKEGYFSTAKDSLAQLKAKTNKQKDFLKFLKERSIAQKALETFTGKDQFAGLIAKIQEDGCIHPMFNMTVTRTGRLSSSDPNGQNLPRKGTSPVKKIFIPKFDCIGNADLSQLEWRVAAYLSQDPVAMREIMEGVDYHLDNALRFFGDAKFRTDAKIFGFRLLYGGSAYGMYMDSSMPRFPLKRWEQIVREYLEKYVGIALWQTRNIAAVTRNGGWLKSPSGRILTFQKEGYKGYSERKIKNYPVQSFATADVMPLAMVVIHKRMKRDGFRSKMICQVHDSIVFDMFKEEVADLAKLCVSSFEDLPELMGRFWGIDFNVPLTGDFETGPDYGTLAKFKG